MMTTSRECVKIKKSVEYETSSNVKWLNGAKTFFRKKIEGKQAGNEKFFIGQKSL